MKLIDISQTLNETTPTYPGDHKTTLSLYKTIEKDGFNAYLLHSGLHSGTHIDIPLHLTDDNKTAADFELERFCGKGVLLDVRDEKTITMKTEYKKIISEQDIVLLLTNHDKHYGNEEYFTQHPTISEEFADYLLLKKIKMLGFDMPAPDYAPYTLHKKLLENGVFLLENLTNLQALTSVPSFQVMALPIKISAEASFVRAVCVITGRKQETT